MERLKACKTCGVQKSLRNFYTQKNNRDGVEGSRKKCKIARIRERLYGVTEVQFEQMQHMQGGLCKICLTKAPNSVDHDHVTGVVRGLLCAACNTALGKFKDSVEILRRAIRYLEVSSE